MGGIVAESLGEGVWRPRGDNRSSLGAPGGRRGRLAFTKRGRARTPTTAALTAGSRDGSLQSGCPTRHWVGAGRGPPQGARDYVFRRSPAARTAPRRHRHGQLCEGLGPDAGHVEASTPRAGRAARPQSPASECLQQACVCASVCTPAGVCMCTSVGVQVNACTPTGMCVCVVSDCAPTGICVHVHIRECVHTTGIACMHMCLCVCVCASDGGGWKRRAGRGRQAWHRHRARRAPGLQGNGPVRLPTNLNFTFHCQSFYHSRSKFTENKILF